MNGYSKIRLANKKTRSIDFSDLLSSPPSTQETNEYTPPNHTAWDAAKTTEAVVKNVVNHHHDSATKLEEEDEHANRMSAVKLTRTGSVAPTSSSSRFRLERQRSRRTTGIQSAVKRVFSMRRSSSDFERYCRIHDQHIALEPAFHDDDDTESTDHNAMKTRSTKNKRRGILRACRRLLGF